jgi:dynein heavy chain
MLLFPILTLVSHISGNASLLQKLKEYPKDDLTDKQVKKVNKYFGEDLTLEGMKSTSKAGYGLLTWVVAIIKYYEVAKNVAPLREKVKALEKGQRQTELELNALHATLSALATEIAELNSAYAESSSELDVLQSEAALMAKRLEAASKLIDGLTGERTRWSSDVKGLEEQSLKLVGDCVLGASFLSYVGAFTTDYRRNLIYDRFMGDVTTRGIPLSDKFTIEKLLTTDSTVQGTEGTEGTEKYAYNCGLYVGCTKH